MWHYSERAWSELNIWIRLPPHPNIVLFDRVVLDEFEGRVIGFTNEYIPNGTLEEDTSQVFCLEWLRQLIQLFDFPQSGGRNRSPRCRPTKPPRR